MKSGVKRLLNESNSGFSCFVSHDTFYKFCKSGFVVSESCEFYLLLKTKEREVVVKVGVENSVSESEDICLWMNSPLIENLRIEENDVVVIEKQIHEYRIERILNLNIFPKSRLSIAFNTTYVREWLYHQIISNDCEIIIPLQLDSKLRFCLSFELKGSEFGYISPKFTRIKFHQKPKPVEKEIENEFHQNSEENKLSLLLELSLDFTDYPDVDDIFHPPNSYFVCGKEVTQIISFIQQICDRMSVNFYCLPPSSVYSPYTPNNTTKLRRILFSLRNFSGIDVKKKDVILIPYLDVLFPNTKKVSQIRDENLIKDFKDLLSGLSTSHIIIGVSEEAHCVDELVLKEFEMTYSLDTEGMDLIDNKIRKIEKVFSENRNLISKLKIGELEDGNLSEDQIFRIAAVGHSLSEDDLRLFLKLQDSISLKSNRFERFHQDLKSYQEIISQRKMKKSTSIFAHTEVPRVRWEDIGGLDFAKSILKNHIVFPLRNRKLIQSFLSKRKGGGDGENLDISVRGFLLFGPPGTGKTMLARAVATESSSQLINCHVPDLIRCEVGASERALAEIFRSAVVNSPSVIFFDEIQAMFGQRREMGGYERKLVSQFLLEMDGLGGLLNNGVVVLAATNLPNVLDRAMFRSGRFEKMIYIGPPNEIGRAEIWRKAILPLKISTEIREEDMEGWVRRLTEMSGGFTGADIVNVCQKAGCLAIREDKTRIEEKHFNRAFKIVQPSVSSEYLEEMEKFQRSNSLLLCEM